METGGERWRQVETGGDRTESYLVHRRPNILFNTCIHISCAVTIYISIYYLYMCSHIFLFFIYSEEIVLSPDNI